MFSPAKAQPRRQKRAQFAQSSPGRPTWMVAEDLAPGDRKILAREWPPLELAVVETTASPHFAPAFDALWAEFGAAGEMEQPGVLAARMAWDPAATTGGYAMRYHLMVVLHEGKIAAVTDQTAILAEGARALVVHHSHILVAREWRRTGLAGWVRALPLATARDLLRARGLPAGIPATLALEMEHPHPGFPATLTRLAAMEQAGYKKIDPTRAPYIQPDFRLAREIDQTGYRPVPLGLVLRRVGREDDDAIDGAEVAGIIRALHAMYAYSLRPRDADALRDAQRSGPAPVGRIPLVPPTS